MVVNYEKILSFNLGKLGIQNHEALYAFLEGMGRLPFVGECNLDVTAGAPHIIAEYTGVLKIGDPRESGDRKPIPTEVKKNLREISDSMPAIDGISIGRFHPSLRDNDECYGRLSMDGKQIEITLKRQGQ